MATGKKKKIKYNPLNTRNLTRCVDLNGKPVYAGKSRRITADVRNVICNLIIEGYSMRQIALIEGMPSRTAMLQTLKENEAFQEELTRAREIQAYLWEDEILEIAENGQNDWNEREARAGRSAEEVAAESVQRSKLRIDTRKWLMMACKPKKYGAKVAQEISGPEGAPVSVSAVERTIVEPRSNKA